MGHGRWMYSGSRRHRRDGLAKLAGGDDSLVERADSQTAEDIDPSETPRVIVARRPMPSHTGVDANVICPAETNDAPSMIIDGADNARQSHELVAQARRADHQQHKEATLVPVSGQEF